MGTLKTRLGRIALVVSVGTFGCAPAPPPRTPDVPVESNPVFPPAASPVEIVEPTPAGPGPTAPVQVVAVPAPTPSGPVLGPGPLAVDPWFGDGARVVFRREPGEHELEAVASAGDALFVVGHAQFGGTLDACVARVDETGRLDASFGRRGVARVGAQRAFGTQLAIDARGRLLVAGYFYGAGHAEDLLLARLSPNGTLDRAFGTGGLVRSTSGAPTIGRAAFCPCPAVASPSSASTRSPAATIADCTCCGSTTTDGSTRPSGRAASGPPIPVRAESSARAPCSIATARSSSADIASTPSAAASSRA